MAYRHFSGKPRGFSLMEFLVAAVLGAAVLAAAGSLYFNVLKVGVWGGSRQEAQDDRFQTAFLLRRDIGRAGRFGCLHPANAEAEWLNGSAAFGLTDSDGTLYRSGIRRLSAGRLGLDGFNARSEALLVMYGGDAVVPERVERDAAGRLVRAVLPERHGLVRGSVVVAAGCTQAAALPWQGGRELVLPDGSRLEDLSQIVLMPYTAAVYVVGESGGEEGLYRFERLPDGKWSEAQKLSDGAGALDTEFAYRECAAPQRPVWRFTQRPEADVPPAWSRVVLHSGRLKKPLTVGIAAESVEKCS